jgi:hypothetical protein
MGIKEIYAEARAAADKAANSTPDQIWPCGFAWITVRPRNGHPNGPILRALIKEFKAMNVGHKSLDQPGWMLWTNDYTSYNGQNMDVKEAAANAFAEVFNSYGYPLDVNTRID